MLLDDSSQTFLFTFRPNGQTDGHVLAEVLVEQLADYDPSVAADSYKRSWFGSDDALGPMLAKLGFSDSDVQGVMAALKSHRNVDRKLAVTPDQLRNAGFRELPESPGRPI